MCTMRVLFCVLSLVLAQTAWVSGLEAKSLRTSNCVSFSDIAKQGARLSTELAGTQNTTNEKAKLSVDQNQQWYDVLRVSSDAVVLQIEF